MNKAWTTRHSRSRRGGAVNVLNTIHAHNQIGEIDRERTTSGLIDGKLFSSPPTPGLNVTFLLISINSSGEGSGDGLGQGVQFIWLCVVSSGFNIDSFTMTAVVRGSEFMLR